jgi:hypothetical protein
VLLGGLNLKKTGEEIMRKILVISFSFCSAASLAFYLIIIHPHGNKDANAISDVKKAHHASSDQLAALQSVQSPSILYDDDSKSRDDNLSDGHENSLAVDPVKLKLSKPDNSSDWARVKALVSEMKDDEALETYELITKYRIKYEDALNSWKTGGSEDLSGSHSIPQELLNYKDQLQVLEFELSRKIAVFLEQKYVK